MRANKIKLNNEVLIDLTQDTVEESDVLFGKTFHKADGSIAVGSNVGVLEERDVNFYDYDGTLLYSYSVEEARNLKSLPPLPEHEGLICQEWNHTLERVNTVKYGLDVGATYTTDDGSVRIYITLDERVSLEFSLSFKLDGDTSHDTVITWGDGTSTVCDKTIDVYSHVYVTGGDYVVKIHKHDDCIIWLGSTLDASNPKGVTGKGYEDSAQIYTDMIRRAELPINTLLASYCFYNCQLLKYVTVATRTDITRGMDMGCFRYTESLEALIVPRYITSLRGYFLGNSGVKVLSLPDGLVTIDGYTFPNTYRLKRLVVSGRNYQGIEVNGSAIQKLIFEKPVTNGNGGYESFGGISKATDVVFGELTRFGSGMFGNTGIREIEFREGTEYLYDGCFRNSYRLLMVTMPSSIKRIYAQAFQNCPQLKFVDFTKCEWVPILENSNAFSGNSSDFEIRVSAELYDKWIAATNWSTLADKIVPV